MAQKNSLRGCIVEKWKVSGRAPFIEYDQVLDWARECDNEFRENDRNPAPAFRKSLDRGDEKHQKTYLRGERFPFKIVYDDIPTIDISKFPRVDMRKALGKYNTIPDSSMKRACLKCGCLNVIDGLYCSYCGYDLLPQIRRSRRE